ncbi:hypothetical protein PLESTM_000782800 [Pleodorina starrii]|nr:hypothetical protein PLESTM_000782800 [Pleodorina starrii]
MGPCSYPIAPSRVPGPPPLPTPLDACGPARPHQVPAQASKVVGPLRAAVLQTTTCARPAASHAWAPANKKASPRVLDVSFLPSNATARTARSVGVYFLNLGTLQPLMTAVHLLVIPPAGSGGSPAAGSQLLVPVFDASRDASPTYICPGLTHFPVSPAAVVRSGMMTAAEFAGSTVVGARLVFNDNPVLAVANLPFVAAVGLFTI